MRGLIFAHRSSFTKTIRNERRRDLPPDLLARQGARGRRTRCTDDELGVGNTPENLSRPQLPIPASMCRPCEPGASDRSTRVSGGSPKANPRSRAPVRTCRGAASTNRACRSEVSCTGYRVGGVPSSQRSSIFATRKNCSHPDETSCLLAQNGPVINMFLQPRGPHSLRSCRTRPLNEEGPPGHDTAPCEGRGLVSRHNRRARAHGGFARPLEPA
jgi:hypothetical protein